MLARTDWPSDYQELFWGEYPRRVAKKAAMKALDAVRRRGEVPFEVLLSAVQFYARSMVGKEMRYVAHPATWLNAGRWDDDPKALTEVTVQATMIKTHDGREVVMIKRDSPQAHAWEAYRGKSIPWGASGAWVVPSEWPPAREDVP